MNVRQSRIWMGVASATVAATAVLAAAPPPFEISRFTIDGGGAMRSTAGDFELSGTIGQPDAGILAGSEYELTGGFWVRLAPGDCNSDGGVSLLDHGDFVSCITGPDSGVTAGCECFDVDRSGAVDLADVAVVQTTFTGQ